MLIGGFLGWLLYWNIEDEDQAGIILGIALTLAGLALGIRWAVKAYKGKGTVHLVSRTMATPELDEKEEE